jgi:hypothetical protein
LFEECLSTLVDSFPECKPTHEELIQYRANVKGNESAEVNMIKNWHKDMATLYERADHHEDTLWEVLPFFNKLSIHQKIQDLGTDGSKVMWEYIDGMNRYSRIYNAIPSQMLEKIQSTAMTYMNKIQSGEMKIDMENLNWNDVKNVGQSLMETINPQDMEEFTGNITGLAQSLQINNIQDVFKLVGEVPGVSEAINNNGHLVGLLGQLLQSDSTREIIQNVDKMMGNNDNNSSGGGGGGGGDNNTNGGKTGGN